jgi:hypothetical protein
MGDLVYYVTIISLAIIYMFYQVGKYRRKKRMIGNAVIRLSTLENYLWIPSLFLMLLPVLNIFRIPKMQFYEVTDLQIEYIKDIGWFILFTLFFYQSIQKTAIHERGIKDSFGVWSWDEVKSFSLKKEGPYQYEEFYNKLFKPKYELTYEVLKNRKTGELKTLIWKVSEKRKDKIHQIITATVPEKEII